MEIKVFDDIVLRTFQVDDWKNLVRYLNSNGVYENTILKPYPYTREAAEGWINQNIKSEPMADIAHNFAIHHRKYGLIGGIGYSKNMDPKLSHQAEIGYWLGEPFWNQGYMTRIVSALSDWIFARTAFTKLTASIFAHNPASGRVLEKCGFQREGLLRQHLMKKGEYLDCIVYGRIKGE